MIIIRNSVISYHFNIPYHIHPLSWCQHDKSPRINSLLDSVTTVLGLCHPVLVSRGASVNHPASTLGGKQGSGAGIRPQCDLCRYVKLTIILPAASSDP